MADTDRLQAAFARWFRAELDRRDLTQEAAARQLDVSLTTVRRWAGGKVLPGFRELVKIRRAWGVLPSPLVS